jgi:hypothetical protein
MTSGRGYIFFQHYPPKYHKWKRVRQQYHFFWYFFFNSMNFESACVNMNIYYNRKNWFWLFMRKWHYDKWRGVYLLTTLSFQVSEIEKSKTTSTIFFYFIVFQFHEFWELMCEYEHLLEQKKIWFGLFVWNWHYNKWRGVIFLKIIIVTPCFTKEWDINYIFFWF